MKDRIPREEIEKWLVKLKAELKKTKPLSKKGEELYRNIEAYIHDTEHFMKEGDFVKAWELVSFAWGLLEAGMELEALKK
ncbi:hypothetical protein A3K63_01305 [Candidatus Micrarchaeota archaeon RBG_16_49_10]|nr:MAG: hypothetical protein A3K63_01305 [Candidatus Micrarchaeota archaeon RBG_16_49_10]